MSDFMHGFTYDPASVADQLEQMFLKEWHDPSITDERKRFLTAALNFIIHARATFMFSPAKAMFQKRPVSECHECGSPITFMSRGFGDASPVDYGVPIDIVTLDGQLESGGLEMAIIRNEKGSFVGLPPHDCAQKSRRRKILNHEIK